MIINEMYVADDGRELVRTYSDANKRIRRNDGKIYNDAIDPQNSGRTYTETDDPIPQDEEVTDADRDAALRLFGVEV